MPIGIGSVTTSPKIYGDYRSTFPIGKGLEVRILINKFFKSKGITEKTNDISAVWTGKIVEINASAKYSALAQELSTKIRNELSVESKITIKPEEKEIPNR